MAVVDKIVIIFLCFVACVLAGEYCTEYDDGLLFDTPDKTFYCSSGCCGTRYNKYCCWESEDAGRIAGIVVGSIAAVGGVITVLVIVFCCCRRGRGAQGQVMRPVGGTTVTTTTVGQTAYPVTTPTYPGAYPYGQPSQTTMVTQTYPQQPTPMTNWEGPKPPPYSEVQ